MPTAIRSKGESGQGIQALRLADAPGGEGSPFAPTRSDCRQCDPMALALVFPEGSDSSTAFRGEAVSTAVPTAPTRYERSASGLLHPNVQRTRDLGPVGRAERPGASHPPGPCSGYAWSASSPSRSFRPWPEASAAARGGRATGNIRSLGRSGPWTRLAPGLRRRPERRTHRRVRRRDGQESC